jgi:2-phosphoglycerate kinase
LAETAGEEFARRYALMQRVRRSRRPIVITIGGTAGTGKSEVAAELAYRLGIVRVVSSDAVRQALRSLIGPDLSPILHASSFEAWMADMLPSERERATPRRKRVIRGFQSQVLQLGTALEAIVKRHMEEGTSLVVEGVHVVPAVRPLSIQGAISVGVLLKVDDPTVHRDRFLLREGRTDARRPKDRYVRHFDEIRMLQEWLVRKADAASVAVVDVTDLDSAVDRVMELVLDDLLASTLGRDAEAEDGDARAPEAAYTAPGGER